MKTIGKFFGHFIGGLALVISSFIIFTFLVGSEEIGALLAIAFSDLYFGRFAK